MTLAKVTLPWGSMAEAFGFVDTERHETQEWEHYVFAMKIYHIIIIGADVHKMGSE